MEINKFDNEITAVVPVADIVEGKFGVFVASSHTYDFGSRSDLPGFRVPATAEESKRARHVITWAVDNSPYPQMKSLPSYTYAMRQGFDQAAQSPAAVTLYLTNPGNQDGVTIPSGTPSLAFGKGVYTLASGSYIYNAALQNPGSLVIVANTAEDTTDAGKLKYQSTYDERVVGFVREFNTSTYALTVEVD